MARKSDFSEAAWQRITELDCPTFDTNPWVTGQKLDQRRVAIISSAGLIKRGDYLHDVRSDEYRVITKDTPARDVLMGHVSVNFDRSGFQQDINVVFPRDRLEQLADDGVIGSVAENHYSFMGATDPREMADGVRDVAGRLKSDDVDAVLLLPV